MCVCLCPTYKARFSYRWKQRLVVHDVCIMQVIHNIHWVFAFFIFCCVPYLFFPICIICFFIILIVLYVFYKTGNFIEQK